MTELLPCPFCGGRATLSERNSILSYYIACSNFNCPARYTALYLTINEAIAAWNLRAERSAWIQCSERLPENSGMYFTYSDVYECFEVNEFDSMDRRSRWVKYSRENIISHWQSLPEPPKADNND